MAPSFALSLLRAARGEPLPSHDDIAPAHDRTSGVELGATASTSPRQRPRKKLSLNIAPIVALGGSQRPSSPRVSIKFPRPGSPLPLLRRVSSAGAMDGAEHEPHGARLLEDRPPPTTLLVLAHGLQGTVEDFTYVLETLESTHAVASGHTLVHASRVNTDKTHDGVDLGGLRLAEDIRAVVARHDSLQTISLVGFSLGGLYVRYAVAHLYDHQTQRVAGLVADKLVIVASPNLGVRQFGVYRFLQGVLPLAHPLLFDTAKQLFLCDDDCLLELMTRDCAVRGGWFVSSLRAFRSRTLYANVRNDFMVNYGTAALDAGVKEFTGITLQHVLDEPAARAIDTQPDDRGCQLRFELQYAAQHQRRAQSRDLSDGDALEHEMAARLRALGWRVVAVDFPMPAPLAHNRIVAMSRNGVHSWMNAGGRRVVHHLADQLCTRELSRASAAASSRASPRSATRRAAAPPPPSPPPTPPPQQPLFRAVQRR